MPGKDGEYPGFAERVAERMKELGFWYGPPKNSPDVLRFSREHPRHVSQYMYAYLRQGRVPNYENLVELAEDLECPEAWLLLGPEGVEKAATWMQKHRPKKRR